MYLFKCHVDIDILFLLNRPCFDSSWLWSSQVYSRVWFWKKYARIIENILPPKYNLRSVQTTDCILGTKYTRPIWLRKSTFFPNRIFTIYLSRAAKLWQFGRGVMSARFFKWMMVWNTCDPGAHALQGSTGAPQPAGVPAFPRLAPRLTSLPAQPSARPHRFYYAMVHQNRVRRGKVNRYSFTEILFFKFFYSEQW